MCDRFIPKIALQDTHFHLAKWFMFRAWGCIWTNCRTTSGPDERTDQYTHAEKFNTFRASFCSCRRNLRYTHIKFMETIVVVVIVSRLFKQFLTRTIFVPLFG